MSALQWLFLILILLLVTLNIMTLALQILKLRAETQSMNAEKQTLDLMIGTMQRIQVQENEIQAIVTGNRNSLVEALKGLHHDIQSIAQAIKGR